MKVHLSPIALFVYNRPLHTKSLIDSLLQNSESKYSDLYVFSDSAKNEYAQKAVNEVRSFIREISGFKSITIIEREKNLGLANSVIEGVTMLCNKHDRVIVLEDDLRVSPHFLDYMNTGLERFQNDDRVMQIAGYMFPASLNIEDDSLFLPFISSWGWATWARAWSRFDVSAAKYQVLKKDKQKIQEFNLDGYYDYFSMLQSQQSGKTNSWAIRWYLSVFYLNGLTLYPKYTLVENLGFDGSGENCIVSTIKTSRLDSDFRVVKYPDSVKVSENYKDVLMALPKPRPKMHLLFSYIKKFFQ